MRTVGYGGWASRRSARFRQAIARDTSRFTAQSRRQACHGCRELMLPARIPLRMIRRSVEERNGTWHPARGDHDAQVILVGRATDIDLLSTRRPCATLGVSRELERRQTSRRRSADARLRSAASSCRRSRFIRPTAWRSGDRDDATSVLLELRAALIRRYRLHALASRSFALTCTFDIGARLHGAKFAIVELSHCVLRRRS